MRRNNDRDNYREQPNRPERPERPEMPEMENPVYPIYPMPNPYMGVPYTPPINNQPMQWYYTPMFMCPMMMPGAMPYMSPMMENEMYMDNNMMYPAYPMYPMYPNCPMQPNYPMCPNWPIQPLR